MTTRKTILATTLALVTAAGLTITALGAQGRPGRGPGGPGGPGGGFPMLQRLDLTDAQRDQIRAIVTEVRNQAPERKLGDLNRQLQAAVMADTPDLGKIEELKTAIGTEEAAALNRRVDLQLRIAQILTPEQRQKARELPAGGPGGRGRGGPDRHSGHQHEAF